MSYTHKIGKRKHYHRKSMKYYLSPNISNDFIYCNYITSKGFNSEVQYNNLVLKVHKRFNKISIKENFFRLFGVYPKKVNTVNRYNLKNNIKIAYINVGADSISKIKDNLYKNVQKFLSALANKEYLITNES